MEVLSLAPSLHGRPSPPTPAISSDDFKADVVSVAAESILRLFLTNLVAPISKLHPYTNRRHLPPPLLCMRATTFIEPFLVIKYTWNDIDEGKVCPFASERIHELDGKLQGRTEGHKRILDATDLVGRGIDIERVNIVFNYDMPDSADTYLHRVGRAVRFGTKGLAITFVSFALDYDVHNHILCPRLLLIDDDVLQVRRVFGLNCIELVNLVEPAIKWYIFIYRDLM
ncbi:hypothetical protein RHGRI_007582 [Rhododendron griersonianum]|uniref:Helicase C-terminal domain-containing protein n=1 Tax=Rhododendron griersonianum TaxID=479676 RepID=A0AAV6KY47_9ERIC|nr:hypothetical protein RHGRI_007582 [Rhododendron griersonianum]